MPGLKIFSWPRWAGPHTLVACLGTRNEPEAIDLLDILRPERARVKPPALEAKRRARHLRSMAALRVLDRGLLLPRSPGWDAGDLEGIGRPGKAGDGPHRRRGAARPYGGAERLSGRPVPGLQRRSARPGGGQPSPVAGSGRPSTPASVRRHRRALRGCLWPAGGWIGSDAAAPFAAERVSPSAGAHVPVCNNRCRSLMSLIRHPCVRSGLIVRRWIESE